MEETQEWNSKYIIKIHATRFKVMMIVDWVKPNGRTGLKPNLKAKVKPKAKPNLKARAKQKSNKVKRIFLYNKWQVQLTKISSYQSK